MPSQIRNIIALDPATQTGVACISLDLETGLRRPLHLEVAGPGSEVGPFYVAKWNFTLKDTKKQKDHRFARPAKIMERLKNCLYAMSQLEGQTVVAFEGLENFGSKSQRSALVGHELRGVIKAMALSWNAQTIEVGPSTLKLYATGKGNADKDQMLEAAQAFGYTGKDKDIADAILVASLTQNRLRDEHRKATQPRH